MPSAPISTLNLALGSFGPLLYLLTLLQAAHGEAEG